MTLLCRILLLLMICCQVSALAQQPLSNLRSKMFPVVSEPLAIDTLSMVPGTFSIAGIDTSAYRIDFARATLTWLQKPAADSVSVAYRVFNRRLDAAVQRVRFDSVANNFSAPPFVFNNNDQQQSFFESSNIQYNGSFGRALAFGNRQDAVVNSNFQLQLSGMLKDSIQIAAALTDNNIPIQPDGTTQQLNEFDQVFLQFKKNNWQLNLGDIDIRQREMYFLNFYKRLQGISYENKYSLSPDVQSSTLVSGSIAKGKFTRNVFQGLEGNQGPYRLTGANNEFFFIVLANTERVFLDGELLQRGEDGDYIINYNTAEVTFMPRRMITKDSRIQVEFEYADRNYLNANLFLYQQLDVSQKLKLKFSAFNNSDAKNSQINQVLDNKQRQFLFNIGDSINKAWYPTVAEDTFSSAKILYEKVYYLNGAQPDSFYRYSTDPQVAQYTLSFSDVGQGNGNYIPDFNGANGKVYRFMEPVNGVKQGMFEPVMQLVTPKKQQVFTLGAEYNISESTAVKTELAMSSFDVNTFSSKGRTQQGFAGRLQISNSASLNPSNGLMLISTVDVEHVQDRFKPVERLRMVEFSREWGLPLVVNPATETIAKLSAEIKNRADQSIAYRFTTYQRSDNYKGFQNILMQSGTFAGWVMNSQLSMTTFLNSSDRGSFFRPTIDVSRSLKNFRNVQLGFRYALENNDVRSRYSDSISALSFSFDTYTAYLRSHESRKNKYALNFFTRADKHPQGKNLVKADRSYNVNLQAELLANPKHQLLLNTTFRILNVYNPSISNQKDDRTLLGRAEYLVNEWKGLVTGNVLYELGAGQEQRRDFAYLEVPAGQGEFTWIDYNNDGVQQINEFEVALFRDQAKYIRIFTPTNQFTKANYTTVNYSVSINPKAVFNSSAVGLASFVSKLNLQSSLQKTKKSLSNGNFELNPFKYSIQDTALLTNNTSFINTVSFNRFSTKWGADLSNLRTEGKSLLTYGYESRSMQDWTLRLRWNVSTSISVDINNKRGVNGLYTPSFTNRNYEIRTISSEPRVSFIRGTTFRLQGSYKFEEKQNEATYGGEHARSNSINFESKYNVLQSSAVQGRFSYNNISFRKNDPLKTNANVEYIIMDALRPGANFLWSLEFTRRLINNVEINFQYEGRRPADMNAIHTGRAAIRALF